MSQWSEDLAGSWQYGAPPAQPAPDDAGDLVAYDPDNPVDHTLTVAPQTATADDAALVACPTCGGGVHPDRIRQ